MSDSSQGEGWWQASDGKWYPPDQTGAAANPAGVPPQWADAAEAKAQGKAAKAYAKAQRPWYKKKRYILGMGLLALIVIVAVAGGGGEENGGEDRAGEATEETPNDNGIESDLSSNEENPPGADVDDVTCTEDLGLITGVVTVTNNSSETSNYLVTVGVEQDGAKIGDGFGSLDNVDPGQTGRIEVVATADSGGNPFTCVVDEVERFSS